jgi:TRAP-type C4-dicarboxylate transport system permease small subunit
VTPPAALRRLTAGLDRATCGLCVGLFGAIFVTMIAQILFRYVFNAPLVWTEELARYLYVWACWLGAAVALRRGNHIVVALVTDRLPPGPGRTIAVGGQVLALFFLVELAIQGIRLALRTHTIMAITLPIPWSAIYAAAPVAAGLMILQTLESGWTLLGRGAAR